MSDDSLLDVTAAAARLHVSRSYLYQLAYAKAIEHVRVGRRLLFTAAQLEAFIGTHSVPAEPVAGLRLERRETGNGVGR